MEIGTKIKKLRRKYGYTQEELAERLNVTSQTISKWENQISMPDISLLPQIAEVFGVTIDDLFNLSIEQKLDRIENKFDLEEELSDVEFTEIKEFLESLINDENHKLKATYLLTFLYTHRLMADSRKIKKYGKLAIKLNPALKENTQWMLGKAENDYCWDWDISNHNSGINFYKEVVNENKEVSLPYHYLIWNLIIDHRCDEAEYYLNKLKELRPDAVIITEAYRAGIELARFNEKKADEIMANLEKSYPDDEGCLFEIAQYYTKKGQFEKAIAYYEKSFEKDEKRPRYSDCLLGILAIYDILGDKENKLITYERIIEFYKNEWHMKDEVALKDMVKEKEKLEREINKK